MFFKKRINKNEHSFNLFKKQGLLKILIEEFRMNIVFYNNKGNLNLFGVLSPYEIIEFYDFITSPIEHGTYQLTHTYKTTKLGNQKILITFFEKNESKLNFITEHTNFTLKLSKKEWNEMIYWIGLYVQKYKQEKDIFDKDFLESKTFLLHSIEKTNISVFS